MPQDITGYLYTQQNPPRGWNPNLYWAWDGPVNVLLVPKIPSANKVGSHFQLIKLTFLFLVNEDL